MIIYSYVELIKILFTNSVNNRPTFLTNMIEIDLKVKPIHVANI